MDIDKIIVHNTGALKSRALCSLALEPVTLPAMTKDSTMLLTGESADLDSLVANISSVLAWFDDNTFDSEVQFQCRVRLNGTRPVTEKLIIKRVIFNDPATVIYWADGSKTVVKCQSGDTFDREKGFLAAYMKKVLGNKNEFNKLLRKWVQE